MNVVSRRLIAGCAAGLMWWPFAPTHPVLADETRAHVRPIPAARGFVLATLDTSAAAAAPLRVRSTAPASATPACPSGRVYWRRGGGPPPPCESAQWVTIASATAAVGLRCTDAAATLAARGFHVARRLRQWDALARQWTAPTPALRGALECAEDTGRHGAEPGAWYAADGESQPWSRSASHEIAWDEDAAPYTLYSSRYVARWHAAARASSTAWDVQLGAVAVLGAAAGGGDPGDYEFGVLRHSWNGRGVTDENADGGMVIAAATPTGRATLPDALRSVLPGGGAPWTETLFETARYLRAEPVQFGLGSRATPEVPSPSVPESRAPATPARYADHWPHGCSRAHVLALAAGAPSHDASGPANARSLPGFDMGYRCDGEVAAPCLPALLRWLGEADASGRVGQQHARATWLAVDANTPEPVVPRGSAGADWALGETDRADALPLIVGWLARARYATPGSTRPSSVAAQVSSLASGAGIAYAGAFLPGRNDRWRGELRPVARAGTGALEVGAGFRPALPARRRLYTDLVNGALATASNAVRVENRTLSAALLGLAPTEHARRERTLAWARGVDTEDADGDDDRLEPRGDLGAVVGGSLATVRYAGAERVYAGTGDGVLHAFDPDGDERWAFIPRAFLAHLDELRTDRASGVRHAGLDAELRTLVVDRNADGRVDAGAGERAILYFGLRRGGRAYLAVDVTEPDAPRVLWTLTPRELPALAQTWASPVPAKLTIAGVRQNPDRRVVLLAGGHDPAQDVPRARARDRIGAALYLVDAYSGALLWHASARAAERPDLVVDALDYALAATPRALDLDEDGELDRAYVADTGGRLFRIDFQRGAVRGSLARAELLADVGGVGTDDRRFYAEPDVALVRRPGGNAYLAVSLGSGFAPDPNAQDAANRLYSIRDALGLRAATAAPLTEATLPDASDGIATEVPGWKLPLAASGEKIVVAARTVDHRVYVPAYLPPTAPPAPDCTQPPGSNRIYAVDVRNAARTDHRVRRPPEDTDDGGAAAPPAITGVAPALSLVKIGTPTCTAGCAGETTALLGLEQVDVRWPGRIVRTGWAEREVE